MTYIATCLAIDCGARLEANTPEELSELMGDHMNETHDGVVSGFHQELDEETTIEQDRERIRALRHGDVIGLLFASDRWFARAYEEGVPVSGEKTAYRQALRALLPVIASSSDPSSIEIPDPPA